MSMHRGIKKEGVVRVMHSRLSLSHKNKTTPFAALWMDLEIVRLSEVSLTEKANIL